jgi:hypothetical protein
MNFIEKLGAHKFAPTQDCYLIKIHTNRP